jgi:WS/DGAT C-terminal domain
MNTYVADVAGLRLSLHFAGAPVLEVFPVMPLMGNISTGVGALSYAAQFNLMAVADKDLCPDLEISSRACGAHWAHSRIRWSWELFDGELIRLRCDTAWHGDGPAALGGRPAYRLSKASAEIAPVVGSARTAPRRATCPRIAPAADTDMAPPPGRAAHRTTLPNARRGWAPPHRNPRPVLLSRPN